MLRRALDNLPFGKAPLLLLILAVASGAWLLLHPVERPDANIRVWTFVYSNWETYRKVAPEFEATHPGSRVDIQNIQYFALQNRLRSAFWADLEVPDIVELEISHAGGFFRGPTEDIGFVDLTPYLERDNLLERMVPSRFAPYRNRGHQYGLPLDLHPVMIAYRRDLFEELGIDAGSLRTWDDFIREGRRVSADGRRFMILLAASNANHFEVFLFQNDGAYFDEDGSLVMDDEKTLETLLWYIPLVAGPGRIANDLGSDQVFTQALEEGYFLCVVAPDWMANHIRIVAPKLEGRMALMPLPVFRDGGRRTSTWGGTMLAITKGSPDPDRAWEFVKSLRLDPAGMEARFREQGIIPPFKEAWGMEAFKEPHPYWSNQPIGELFASVAEEVPPQYASPHVSLAKAKMGEVVSSCSTYYAAHGDAGFEAFARARLAEAAAEVRRAMTRNPFQ